MGVNFNLANFTYEAVNESGKKLKGMVKAQNKQLAITELRGRGITIRSIQEQRKTTMDLEIHIGRAVKLEGCEDAGLRFAASKSSGRQRWIWRFISEGQSS